MEEDDGFAFASGGVADFDGAGLKDADLGGGGGTGGGLAAEAEGGEEESDHGFRLKSAHGLTDTLRFGMVARG